MLLQIYAIINFSWRFHAFAFVQRTLIFLSQNRHMQLWVLFLLNWQNHWCIILCQIKSKRFWLLCIFTFRYQITVWINISLWLNINPLLLFLLWHENILWSFNADGTDVLSWALYHLKWCLIWIFLYVLQMRWNKFNLLSHVIFLYTLKRLCLLS